MSADIPPLNHTLLWLAKPEEPIKPVADMRLLLQLDSFRVASGAWKLSKIRIKYKDDQLTLRYVKMKI